MNVVGTDRSAPVSYSMAGRDDRVPNALGGLIGGAIVDNSFGASAIPFAAAATSTRMPSPLPHP
jgi:predicted MFS family arabinose efflux permease